MTPEIKRTVPGIHGDTPIPLVAHRVLKSRLLDLERHLAAVKAGLADDRRPVHQLRVASRRAAAAVGLLRDFLDPVCCKKVRRLLRRIRRATGRARGDDVYIERLSTVSSPKETEAAREYVLAQLQEARRESYELLGAVADGHLKQLSRLRRRIVQSSNFSVDRDGTENGGPYNLRELAGPGLTRAVKRYLDALDDDHGEVTAIHHLRIQAKRLRYAMQILAPALPDEPARAVHSSLEELQARLGEISDRCGFADRLVSLAENVGTTPAAGNPDEANRLATVLSDMAAQERAALADSQAAFLRWLRQPDRTDRLRREMEALWQMIAPHAACNIAENLKPEAPFVHRRVAAIDVGTNSVRLVIAESDPTVPFRIIEDLKEMTRLGRGLYTTGHLQPAPMDATLIALERMRKAAEDKSVDRICAVGTSAVREARNRSEFLELALQRTGIDIEVLDAEDEARFAFSSVAQSFQLDDRCVAVADIGGGSTELVRSTAGVIDSIDPLPLGAVRLTELYGSNSAPGGYRYEEMVAVIGRTLSERLHRSRHSPYMIIGTGGTFTSMARVALNHNNAGAHVRFPFSLGGYEFRRADVARLLDWLRGMPLEERKRVSGLSSGRAEIIVAGVCIVDRLMQFFGVDRLRVHDGGIRDGLLARAFDQLGVSMHRPRVHGPHSIESVREFARKCEYDAAHSEHVAFLSLRIFDQLAGEGPGIMGSWSRPENRPLLHAAAIAHDVGLMMGVEQHHRHSYDLLMHAELPAFTRREVEVIANVCRYHRRRGPKRKDPNFARLGDDDQRIVAHLAGILRIADGLDRTHQKAVSDVTVKLGAGEITFQAASESKPQAELRYASKKADLFEAAFHNNSRIVWAESTPPAEVAAEAQAAVGGVL